MDYKKKIVELEEKLEECRIEARKQLKEEGFLEKVMIKINKHIKKYKYRPKYLIADFIARAKIKCLMEDYLDSRFSEREGITFHGMKIINAEECLILLEEEKSDGKIMILSGDEE